MKKMGRTIEQSWTVEYGEKKEDCDIVPALISALVRT